MTPLTEKDKSWMSKEIKGFCDMNCEYAEFSKEEWTGKRSCGTFQNLYCKKKKEIVLKNKVCDDYKQKLVLKPLTKKDIWYIGRGHKVITLREIVSALALAKNKGLDKLSLKNSIIMGSILDECFQINSMRK